MIFVIVQQGGVDAGLKKSLEIGIGLRMSNMPNIEGMGYRIQSLVLPGDQITRDRLVDAFDSLAGTFAKWLGEDPKIVAIVGEICPDHLEPLTGNGSCNETLISMLILAFPEIRWLFGVVRDDGMDSNKLRRFVFGNGLHRLFKPDSSPLFDDFGLRNWVHDRIREIGRVQQTPLAYLPRRAQLAVAMDEEREYALLHAWSAYRFGFRVSVVSRMVEAEAVFCNPSPHVPLPSLTFEDLYLNFPDGKGGLSDLGTRANELQGLCHAPVRILVTSDHDSRIRRNNLSHIRRLRATGQRINMLLKPHSGIFSLWKKSGLSRTRFSDSDRRSSVGEKRRGVGSGFVWPPVWLKEGGGKPSGHSSPGILVVIARHMLNRAERMLRDGVATVEDAVRGALLANDALELLGGKTPTMSAEALALKHQFEVHAECQFTGVEHHLEMGDRVEEIRRDAEAIARWFSPRKRKRTALNIRLDVINKLVRILRGYNQFDEERYCMVEARRLHRKLYVMGKWYRWFFWPFVFYADWLLSSFPKFAAATAGWIGGVWLIYHAFQAFETAGKCGGGDRGGPFELAVGTFLGVDTWGCHPYLGTVVIVSGLFHLGIFISLVYDLVSRK